MTAVNNRSINYTARNQWIALLGVSLLSAKIGIILSWVSPNLPYLESSESPIHMNKDQTSWLASYANLGAIIGSFLGSALNMRFGCRKTILMTFLVIAVAWILVIVANSAECLYAFRWLGGIAKGMCYIVFGLYLGEIAPPGRRGLFISFGSASGAIGNIIGLTAETYIPGMTISSSIYLGLCLLGILIFLWVMDSPYYLVKRNDLELAKRSIIFYGAHDHLDMDKKLSEIKHYVSSSASQSLRGKIAEFTSPVVRKSMIIVIVLYTLDFFSGSPTFSGYLQKIMMKSESNIVKPAVFVILTKCMSVTVSFLTSSLTDKLGRRLVMTVSSIGAAVGMSGLGTHFLLLEHYGVDGKSIQWLPVVSVLITVFFFAVGFVTVPNTVASEIFPSSVKSIAACVAALTSSLASFACVKAYQPTVDNVGQPYPFFMYAGCSLLFLPVIKFLMIETKGKSLQEIQDQLLGTRRRDRETKV